MLAKRAQHPYKLYGFYPLQACDDNGQCFHWPGLSHFSGFDLNPRVADTVTVMSVSPE